MVKNILYIFLLLSLFKVAGQSDQAEYLEAKRLFKTGQYSASRASFGALLESDYFGLYSSFYYALSAYKQGDTSKATNMWLSILEQNPDWEQRDEVFFWLAYAYLEKGQFAKGLEYASMLTKSSGSENQERKLIKRFVEPFSAQKVREIIDANPDYRQLAAIYIDKMDGLSLTKAEVKYLNSLVDKWEFSDAEINKLPTIKKEAYNIGVFLPFMFDSLQSPGVVLNNSLVTDLYQGMQLATHELAAEGINLRLYPFDTQRSAERTKQILQNNAIEDFDLIVGPLYSKPNALLNEYSKENQINKINPVSGNPKVLGDSRFSFLFMPDYETMAKALADQVKTRATNKNGMIFYEQNERDSLFASVFRQELEEDSTFNIVVHAGLNKENARAWLDTLIAQYDVYWTQDEADSLQEAGRLLRNRRLNNKELALYAAIKGENPFPSKYRNMTLEEKTAFLDLVSYDNQNRPIYFYDKSFYMEKDSIGFVIGATRKNYLANNLISILETRDDSTQLYGMGEWIDFTVISYEQLERIGVQLVHPQYVDRHSEVYDELSKYISDQYSQSTTVFHVIGYEMILQLGSLMNTHGKYFQIGLRNGSFKPGKILNGMKYGAANDNQHVPIVKFENSKLEVVNSKEYDD